MAHRLHILPAAMTRTHQTLLLTVAFGLVAAAPTAKAAEDLDAFREVSYLVFPRGQGFDRPTFAANLFDGTVEIRFRRLPKAWKGLLAPQLLSTRKQRFFERMAPIVERGRVVGIRASIGVGAFRIRTYKKRRPTRWVLRVGELRTPPFDMDSTGVPVVPYSDLIEEDTPGREAFASAELALARGRLGRACQVFQALRTGDKAIRSWAGLREADCLLAEGRNAMAIRVLNGVVEALHTPAARLLARIRIQEASGRAFAPRLNATPYLQHSSAGTVSDEAAYRYARIRLLRGETQEALKLAEALYEARPRSPFFLDMTLLHAVRWRAIREAAADQSWLLTARTYLAIPPAPATMPHWLEMHQLGAHALREIGLGHRAVRIYLHLLKTKGVGLQEAATILALADTYREAGDDYRARITLKYLVEQHPKMDRDPRVIRVRGELALHRQDDRRAGELASAMHHAAPAPTTDNQARFLAAAAIRIQETEGIEAARRALSEAPGVLGHDMRRDLAMAAGDCDAMTREAGPLYLAEPEDLLLSGACLMGQRRHAEALVFLEAARVYAGAELERPALTPLLDAVLESARWWFESQRRLPSGTQAVSSSKTSNLSSAPRAGGEG